MALDCLLVVNEEKGEGWVHRFGAQTKTEAIQTSEDFIRRTLGKEGCSVRQDFPFKKDPTIFPKARLYHAFCQWE